MKKHKQVIDEDLLSLPQTKGVYADQNSDQLASQNPDAMEKIVENDRKKFSGVTEEETQESQEKQRQKIDEVEQTLSKHSSKKKIWNWVFFAVNILVVVGILLYQILGEGEIASPIGLNIHIWPLLALLAVFALVNLSESFGISYLIKRNVGRWRFGLAYKTNALGRHYDSVTPLATGGQPFQIAYLKNRDIPLHSAMSIPLAKMVFHQICWNVISLVCIIVSFVTPKFNTFVSIASIIGFVLGSALLFVIIFLSISRNWGKKVILGVLKLLQKMRILKNYEKHYEKIMKTVEDYQSVMRQYAKSPRDFIIVLLTYFVKLFAQYSLPYFIFAVFNGFENSLYFDFFTMSVLIDLAAGFFPLPGGTGMSELTFAAMFASYFSGGTLFWALLVWRFFSYYFFLLQGITIISYDMFYGNRKYKWQQRKEMLEQESQIFKQEQINRFRAERNRQRKIKAKKTG